MGINRCNGLISCVKYCALLMLLLTCTVSAAAQTGFYVPSTKPVRNMQKALENPEVFHLLLCLQDDETGYSVAHLDLLDSAYGIAFAVANPMLYTLTIEGYGGDNEQLTRERVDAVYRYFAMRSHAQFPIRFARNPIHCSCNGDTAEILRFEVPVTTAVYRYASLPESRRLLNKSVDLRNSVLIA